MRASAPAIYGSVRGPQVDPGPSFGRVRPSRGQRRHSVRGLPPGGIRVTRPDAPDGLWLAAHEWRWDPTRLDEIIAEATRLEVPSMWLCGWAANGVGLAD